MAAKRVPNPIKYHGGKFYLAQEIVKLFPKKYTHYVEPYAGGLSVLLAANPEGVSEVANDTNGFLMNFWTVIQGEASLQSLKRLCEATPVSSSEWGKSVEDFKTRTKGIVSYSVAEAWRFFILCRQSMAGRMKSFTPVSRTRTRRGMNEQVSAWLTGIEGLPEVHARMKRVLLLCDKALNVIKSQDGKKTLFYLDPTYLPNTRTAKDVYGEHEMSYEDHEELLEALCKIKGKFILSGYRSALYDSYAKKRKWRARYFDVPNNAAGGKSKRRMIEAVWMNY